MTDTVTAKPKRIQMSRQRPWRHEHPDAVIVARPTKWGNPWKIVSTDDQHRVKVGPFDHGTFPTRSAAATHAVAAYKWQIINHPNVLGYGVDEIRAELAGRDLACWCPLDQPCHGDVLLELANGGA